MQHSDILLQQAATLHNQKKYVEADAIYLHILKAEPNHPQAMHFHGLILANGTHIEQALDLLEASIKLLPDRADCLHNTASIHSRVGHKDRAIELFSQAIYLQADYADAYLGLIECQNNRHQYDLLERIHQQLDSNHLTQQQRMNFHFSAARICDESEQYADAFKHYQQANSLKKASFDINKFTQFVDEMIQTFSPEFIRQHQENGLYSHRPIFILGMPRSGTSLVEAILSSHSMIHGAGELNDMPSIGQAIAQASPKQQDSYPTTLKSTTPNVLNGFALAYLNRLSQLSPDAARIINKHPLNFQHIGLIRLMFPNAQIIHTSRNPLDTCLSCYFQNFTNGQEYSFNLDNLAHYYTQYHRLMTHWRRVFKDKFLDIKYEELVKHTEQASRLMVKYCQLPWEQQCLDFHQTQQPIATASKQQVRLPIYHHSINRWKHYDKPLQPLIKRLKHNIEALKATQTTT